MTSREKMLACNRAQFKQRPIVDDLVGTRCDLCPEGWVRGYYDWHTRHATIVPRTLSKGLEGRLVYYWYAHVDGEVEYPHGYEYTLDAAVRAVEEAVGA